MYNYKVEDVYSLVDKIGGETKTKGDELHFKYCPYCKGGSSGDDNTFSINLNAGVFKCLRNSCNKQGHFVEMARDFNFPLDNGEIKKYRKLPQKKIEVRPKAIEYLNSRGISRETVEKYKVTTQKDNENILVFPFYDENNILQFAKYRNIIKTSGGSKEWCEKDTKPILFGMNLCEGFEELIITEGQIDTLSVAESGFKNVVSVPTGANGFTWVKHCYDWISKFKKVIVFGDYEKGKMSLLDKLNEVLECPVYAVRGEDYLFKKDANDILQKYGKQAIVTAIKNAEMQEVDYVIRLADVKPVDMTNLPRIKTGIYDFDKAIGGIYFSQVTLLSGKCGDGKSTFMSQIVAEALEQDITTFVYSGELHNSHFQYWLDLQIAGTKNISVRKNEYGDNQFYLNDKVLNIIHSWYYDNAFIFDNSSIGKKGEFTGILDVVTKVIKRYNVKLICIDNLMSALDDDPESNIYRKQSMFVKQLARIAKQYDVAIILIAHPKKSKDEFENDTVSGSKDITNAVDLVMNYERVRDEEVEFDSKLSVTKNRLTGRLMTGSNAIELVYSEKSKRIQSYKFYTENKKAVENKQYSCFKEKTSKEVVEDVLEGLPF